MANYIQRFHFVILKRPIKTVFIFRSSQLSLHEVKLKTDLPLAVKKVKKNITTHEPNYKARYHHATVFYMMKRYKSCFFQNDHSGHYHFFRTYLRNILK
jgi:hypothetical protein